MRIIIIILTNLSLINFLIKSRPICIKRKDIHTINNYCQRLFQMSVILQIIRCVNDTSAILLNFYLIIILI